MIYNLTVSKNSLRNKTILVTGASKGIGRAVAKAYANEGATVILLARSIKDLEAVYDEIDSGGYPKPAIYPFNLATATPDDYQDLVQSIQENFGKLDGLLHNAAMLGSLTPIEHYPIEQWYQVMQVNLNSVFLLSKACLPLLKRAEYASIIFTLANEGLRGKAYWGAYGVSKFGIQGLMQILADELEENTNIRVNSINPRVVETALRRSAYPAEPLNLHPKVETLLPLYLYLMGPDSLEVRGQNFDSQGNQLMSLR